MFVTRVSLRGFTQMMGTFNIHLALLITVLAYYPNGESDLDEQQPGAGNNSKGQTLYLLMIIAHGSLVFSTLCMNANLFEGMLQQIICYTSVILYFLMVNFAVRAIYKMPGILVIISDADALTRFIFLSMEFFVFISTILSNLTFLGIRMLTPNQINLISIEPKRQLATTDSLESLTLLMNQYQGFVIPCLTSIFILKAVGENTPAEKKVKLKLFFYVQCV